MIKKFFNLGNFIKLGGLVAIPYSIKTIVNYEYINPIHFGICGVILGVLLIIEGFLINKSKKQKE